MNLPKNGGAHQTREGSIRSANVSPAAPYQADVPLTLMLRNTVWEFCLGAVATCAGVVVWLLALSLPPGNSLEAPMLLAAATAVLAALAVFAIRIRGALGGIMLTLAVYWFLGFVARPSVLLWLKPPPRFGDTLSDGRISSDYGAGISQILEKALPAFLLLLVLVMILQRFAAPKSSALSPIHLHANYGLILIGVGWIPRVYVLLEGAPSISSISVTSSIVMTLTVIPTVMAGLIIATSDRLSRPIDYYLSFVGIGWALSSAAKTPVWPCLYSDLSGFSCGLQFSPCYSNWLCRRWNRHVPRSAAR